MVLGTLYGMPAMGEEFISLLKILKKIFQQEKKIRAILRADVKSAQDGFLKLPTVRSLMSEGA